MRPRFRVEQLLAGQVGAGPLGDEQPAAVVEGREERVLDQRRAGDFFDDQAGRHAQGRAGGGLGPPGLVADARQDEGQDREQGEPRQGGAAGPGDRLHGGVPSGSVGGRCANCRGGAPPRVQLKARLAFRWVRQVIREGGGASGAGAAGRSRPGQAIRHRSRAGQPGVCGARSSQSVTTGCTDTLRAALSDRQSVASVGLLGRGVRRTDSTAVTLPLVRASDASAARVHPDLLPQHGVERQPGAAGDGPGGPAERADAATDQLRRGEADDGRLPGGATSQRGGVVAASGPGDAACDRRTPGGQTRGPLRTAAGETSAEDAADDDPAPGRGARRRWRRRRKERTEAEASWQKSTASRPRLRSTAASRSVCAVRWRER